RRPSKFNGEVSLMARTVARPSLSRLTTAGETGAGGPSIETSWAPAAAVHMAVHNAAQASARRHSATRIHHHRRDPLEERPQGQFGLARQRGLGKRARHQLDPPVAGRGIDGERRMSHAKAGMSALLDIPGGTTESAN